VGKILFLSPLSNRKFLSKKRERKNIFLVRRLCLIEEKNKEKKNFRFFLFSTRKSCGSQPTGERAGTDQKNTSRVARTKRYKRLVYNNTTTTARDGHVEMTGEFYLSSSSSNCYRMNHEKETRSCL
jgi:hypothetical protein